MSVQIRPKQSSLTVKVDRTNHENLTKRDNPNQHPIEAITGLAEALTELNNLIISLQDKVDTHDSSSIVIITDFTEKLTNLINEEKNRAEIEEKVLRDTINETQQDIVSLNSEISKLQNTQEEIIDNFNIEHDRTIEAETTLRQEIINEHDRAVAAESFLSSTITNEAAITRENETNILKIINLDREKANDFEADITTKLNEEVGRATKSETLIRTELTEDISDVQTNLNVALTNEINRATEKENLLADDISTIKTSIDNVIGFDASNKADLIDGKIPVSQLPEDYNSNNIISEETVDDFPAEGAVGNLYISTSTNIIYRWDGTSYVEISSTKFNDDETIAIICEI